MQFEDRPIHFSTELIFPPLQIKVPAIQKLYYALSQIPGAGYDNTHLNPPGPPRLFSRRGAKTQSILLFLPDRLAVIEEWVDVTLPQFVSRVNHIALQALDVFELNAFTAQTVTLRTTFGLTHFEDARVFLMDHMCGQRGRIGQHFQRPVAVGGLRFALPKTDGYAGDLNLIVESYRHGRNDVLVEAKGGYPNLEINAHSVEQLEAHINEVRSFVTENVFPFLQQYDVPQEPPV